MPLPYDTDRCKVCKKELSELQKQWAKRHYEETTCSPECRRKELVRQFACCEKAVLIGCVCAYAFECPEHGQTHVGTHD